MTVADSSLVSAPPRLWRPYHTILLAVLTIFLAVLAWLAATGTFHLGLYHSWLVVMAAIVAFCLIAGHGIKGVWRGVFIDDRNKISLSRLQMFTWTVLIISAFGTIGVARAITDPRDALDIAVPATIWLLMGISTTSLIGSPLIKESKQRQPEPPASAKRAMLARQGLSAAAVEVDGSIVKNRNPRHASWSDLFTSEELSNVSFLDLGKVQMFFFTVLVVITYATAIAVSLQGESAPAYLPDVGDGMVTLLGISHAGYLASKATSATGPKQEMN